MRILVVPALLCLMAGPVFAQNAAPNTDWKSLGRPVDDDSKAMMDRYVYFDDLTTDKGVPVYRPVMSQSDISDWVKVNLAQVLTFGARDFDAKIRSNAPLFTPQGYREYIAYLGSANMDKFLKDNTLKVAAYVDGIPSIENQGMREIASTDPNAPKQYVYVWQVKAQLILSYLDYRNQPPAILFPQADKRTINNRFPAVATMDIVRIPMREDGNLVAIDKIDFKAP